MGKRKQIRICVKSGRTTIHCSNKVIILLVISENKIYFYQTKSAESQKQMQRAKTETPSANSLAAIYSTNRIHPHFITIEDLFRFQ